MGGINLEPFQNYAYNAFGAAGRAILQSANVGLQSITSQRTLNGPGIYSVGTIRRAGAGTYDVLVQGTDGPAIPCMLLTDLSSYYMGVSDCFIPVEGSKVLYYRPSPEVKLGYVVGVIPSTDLAATVRDGSTPPAMLTHMWEVEPSANSATEEAYQQPLADPNNSSVLNSNSGRPIDLFPGNRAWLNEQGVGMAILNLMASLRGSERAKIEVSCIDDMVRVVSGYFRHHNSQGEDAIYNDGGYVTRVQTAGSYQFDRYGFDDYAEAWTDSGGTKFVSSPKESRYKLM